MKIYGILFKKVGKRPSYTTVMALIDKLRLLQEEISSCFVFVLLRVATVGAAKVIQTRLDVLILL
jgi:hypothetical protein